MKHLLWLLFSLLVLQACTPVQVESGSVAITAETKKAWQQRQQTLSTIPNWLLKGRASVTYRGENWPFSLQWQQRTTQAYDLTIYHPLTRNRLGKLTKQAKNVSFIDSKGKTYRDTSAEHLLQQQLAIKIPIEGMQYWMRGIIAPHYPVESFLLDSVGRPTTIQQAGWTVRYTDYNGRAYDALPQRVDIIRTKPEAIKVKIRIKLWGA
jgi:outer membrane lipoprotein LolB